MACFAFEDCDVSLDVRPMAQNEGKIQKAFEGQGVGPFGPADPLPELVRSEDAVFTAAVDGTSLRILPFTDLRPDGADIRRAIGEIYGDYAHKMRL